MIKKIKDFMKKNCTIKNFLILFLIVQPIFELKYFYNSFSTLIRVFFIITFFMYYFISNKNKKKYFLLFYPILLIIYFVFHHLNALNFSSLVPGNFNYSILNEILYFVKMLCPFLLIYSLLKANLSKKEIFLIIKSAVLFISLVIIISNIFLCSYGTYSDVRIKANFFEWFNTKSSFTYKELSSKGLFESANQISAILLICLPFVIILNLQNKNKVNFFVLLCNIIAMLFLGTKVAVFGIIIVFLFIFFTYIILTKHIKPLFILLPFAILYICLLPFNPTFSRFSENELVIEASLDISDNQNITQNTSSVGENTDSKEYKINYIKSNYKNANINENFILNRYPYQYDVDFWYDIITSDNPRKSDYRFLEQTMVERVIEINNNPYDILFGITYTRVQNIFNIEKDFVMQFYSLGIIGTILVLLPYFIFLIYWILENLSNKLKNINFIELICFITTCMMFFVAYYSGNLLNSLGFCIYLSLMIHILIPKNLKF